MLLVWNAPHMWKTVLTVISLGKKDIKADGNKEFWVTLDKEEVALVTDALQFIWNSGA